MLIIFSALAAIIPMTIYLILIWRFDKYDREPFGMVLANYLWGAVGAIFLALVGSIFLTTIISFFVKDDKSLGLVGAVAVAPFVEEITKGIFLLITVGSRKFDNITDGIVYGGAIGLGFGMTENFLYFVGNADNLGSWIAIIIIRTLFSAVMHCVSTATLGAFLGYSKFMSKGKRILFTLIGLAIAMFIHAGWNSSVSFQSTAPLGFLFLFITVLIFITVFVVSVARERKIIFNELSEEAANGIIPSTHLSILSSSVRELQGWVPESIRKDYIKSATTLAFRKMQARNSNGGSKIYYENDIDNYRRFISFLLSGTKA
ncbi:Putative membrane protein [Ignavibacterium album JCM 16511]|uniref:Putative membrane protein n=1 Tax=Ignavibacterium album (strain DSM 19864 / JCM 16511 / NBRC 101810 / Mat9-16) TaxID=945713 RepID=I0AL47_IGNAJ|nr:PrsW family intramembrane metalloprotease [Ignavibacterium album]AFH49704.1 Putative membrane protein [Ignavibacterium album JCM 16511]